MPAITSELILSDKELRRCAYLMLRLQAEAVIATREGNMERFLNLTLALSRDKELILKNPEIVLGRKKAENPQLNILNIGSAIMKWLSWLFAAATRFWGAMILMLITCISLGLAVYLQYTALPNWQRPDYRLKAKILTIVGDGVESIFLWLLDFTSYWSTQTATAGLILSASLRITGKVFANSLRWSKGGIAFEVLGEVFLCLSRWRFSLTEGRWRLRPRWKLEVDDQRAVSPAKQSQLWESIWTVNYSTEFEDDENKMLRNLDEGCQSTFPSTDEI